MKIMRKTLLIAGISSALLFVPAFAAEEVAADGVLEAVTVEIQTEAVQDSHAEAAEKEIRKGIVTVDILNVRSGPSTENEKLGKLSLGTSIEILSESEGWYEINFESVKAYVSSEYVIEIKYNADSAETQLSGDSIVEYAKQYLGTPYAYGGNTPSGFDCSGFVQYVMSNFGVTMPRSSTEQYSIGVRVDKSQLLPGDLVYFKYSASSSRLSHVGIYTGNGNFIHSPVPGQTVRIDTLSSGYFSNYYYGATRVMR